MSEARALAYQLKYKGKSQTWLAERLGVSTAAVNQWVKGVRRIPEDRIWQIEVLLGALPLADVQTDNLPARLKDEGSPMAFLLSIDVPEAIVPKGARRYFSVGTQEHIEWALSRWAQYLELTEAHLLGVAFGRKVLEAKHLALVFATGVGLTYLGEHLGERIPEDERVEMWLEQQGKFDSFTDLWERAQMADYVVERERNVDPGAGRQQAADMWEADGGKLPTTADNVYQDWRST